MRTSLRVNLGLSCLALSVLGAAGSSLAQDNAALVARGDYLVNAVAACSNCHSPRNPDGSFMEGMDFAGGLDFDLGPLGTVYARNLTPDPDTGIGSWSDAEIIRAIREGKTKEGEQLMPPMPYMLFNNMSDDDVLAMVAYLRSLKPVRNEVPDDKLNVPREQAAPVAPPAQGKPAPPREASVAYGAYLLTAVIDCFDCHTSRDAQGNPDFANGLGAGGFEIHAFGLKQAAANITPDRETGIGDWSDDEIRAAITEGKSRKAWPIFPAMPYALYKAMEPTDLNAIVAFLRTIPPVSHRVERTDWRPPRPAN